MDDPLRIGMLHRLSFLFAIGVATRAGLLLPVFAMLTILAGWRYGFEPWDSVAVPGRCLVLDFLAGVIVYMARDRIPGGVLAGMVSLSISALLLLSPLAAIFSPLFVAHAVAALGCTSPAKPGILASGDYSYGVYLYAFPIQQSLVSIVGGGKPWLVLGLSLLSVGAFAGFSWHCIEKPMLRFKSLLNRENGRRTIIAGQPASATASN